MYTIPTDVFDSFLMCNNAPSSWTYKRLFYGIKSELLKEQAKLSGQDLQVIKRACNVCNGTGVYLPYNKRAEKCNRCTDGVYMINKVVLDRYTLNDTVFHIPTSQDWKQIGLFNNVISGLIEHKAAKNCPDLEFFEVLMFFKKFTTIRQCMNFIREDGLPF